VKPLTFSQLIESKGKPEKYAAGQVFHSQDFPNRLFVVKKGYVKRYQATDPEHKVIELIYGPGYIIPLSQLYNALFGVNPNPRSFIYIYQAMTDVSLLSISVEDVTRELDEHPELYKDFFYESGLRLRSNIFRLASNAIKDDYKKIAHQLVCLAYEFAEVREDGRKRAITLPFPQSSIDIAEQLNISKEVAEAVLNNLSQNKLIKGNSITILDINLLKDIYL
jgi:CRP-like cAMP-binding protein